MPELTWTDEQVAAILALDDTLLVANAGTGKTTTVVGKVLWLLGLPYGVDATTGKGLPRCPDPCTLSEIAAITFTEKAAYDLKRKLREAIEQSEHAAQLRWQLDRACIGTIHSFCGALLREHALRLDIDPTFRVLDSNESWAAQDELIRELLYERLASGSEPVQRLLLGMRMSGGDFSSGAIDTVRCVVKDLRWRQARHREWADGEGLDRDRLRALAGEWDGLDDAGIEIVDTLVRLAREAKTRWESWLQEENARDFDGLILDLRRLLRGSGGKAALEGVRRRFRILIIDEFQDTDVAQRDIAFQIGRNVSRPQLFLVGDPKQSIYRFRGADVSVWNGVSQELERSGACLALSRNFRCAPIIVEFVNAACGSAIGATAAALSAEIPGSRIDYADLEPGVPASSHSGVEWLVPVEGSASEVRVSAAGHVVARIRELVQGGETISDPDTGERRPCQYSDIGVLYRSRTGLEYFETALSEAGIPYWLAGAPHLGERQEILDVLNALRLLGNPSDDLRALGFLRSPLVCLRDEVIAWIRQQSPRVSLLRAAGEALGRDDWFEAPESAQLTHIEREALERGLDTIRTLIDLAPRVALDELVEELLERTGYRMHLLLAGQAEEALANLQSFLHFCGGYRELELGTFLEIWDRWSSQDLGIPQAPLYSKQDQVVTLTTVHAAKGLEWPVVFLVGVQKSIWRDPTKEYWTDRSLGPVLNAKKADRGARNQLLVERDRLEVEAEEARLLYVATTRARDRLILVGPQDVRGSYSEWLAAGLGGGITVRHTVPEPEDVASPMSEETPVPVRPVPSLEWLQRIQIEPADESVGSLPEPRMRFVVSATELMMRDRDPEAWQLRFVHGVLSPREFAPDLSHRSRLPAAVRGTLVHRVLEETRQEAELSAILEETIGGLDDPELERLLAPNESLRDAIEAEIRGVMQSPEWAWYTQGEHYRELDFVHLLGQREWRIGAFDLYRPGAAFVSDPADLADPAHPAGPADPGGAGGVSREGAWVIDFKTHDIEADEAPGVAQEYGIQVAVYAGAAGIRSPVQVALHFTRPGVVVNVSEPSGSGDTKGQQSLF